MFDFLYDNLQLSSIIVSDIHMDFKGEDNDIRMDIFKNALKETKKINGDALITVGDTTSRGEKVNWDFVRKCFAEIGDCSENIILTVGNHDCWSDGEDEYAAGIGEYYSACRDIMGRDLEKPYYVTKINGYSFICLGNESDMGCDADISDEQLLWLENQLNEATTDGKPAFVFCHQSLNGRHGLPRTWDKVEDPNRPPEEGGIGEKSDEVAGILKKFKNVFYFSGHSHMGLCGENMQAKEGYASFQCEEGLNLINLPTTTCLNHHGEINGRGIGLQLEIYDGKVVVRPKDFLKNNFIESVNIKDEKPYYEVDII